ncbi:J domain-containing protein [Polymorphobacter sp.]|uniref:J domain-containing protein n=1 Tax=Polymorphobacter sp. TaxID=1909290 RepID=UPI003F6E4764
MALLFLLGAFALWWVWPRQKKPGRAVDTALAAAHERLGLAPGADAVRIEQAFRERIRTAHPDAGGSARESRELTEARDRLLASLARKGH